MNISVFNQSGYQGRYMVIKLKYSQKEIEDKFSKYCSDSKKNLGWVEIKKKNEKWKINLIKGKGNLYQVNLRWDCWVKDQEILIKRKKTFDQVIQMIFGIILSSIEIMLFIGSFMSLAKASTLNLKISPMIILGIVFYSVIMFGFWMLYYMNFYKNIDKLLDQILEKVLGSERENKRI